MTTDDLPGSADYLWSMDWYRFVMEYETGLDNPYMFEPGFIMSLN